MIMITPEEMKLKHTQHEAIKKQLSEMMKEGVHFFVDNQNTLFPGKKVLMKAGAELIADVFSLKVRYSTPHVVTFESTRGKEDQVVVECTLVDDAGGHVAVGYGARKLALDDTDYNISMKIAKKNALIDAALTACHITEAFIDDKSTVNSEVADYLRAIGNSDPNHQATFASNSNGVIEHEGMAASDEEKSKLMDLLLKEAPAAWLADLPALFNVAGVEQLSAGMLESAIDMVRASKQSALDDLCHSDDGDQHDPILAL